MTPVKLLLASKIVLAATLLLNACSGQGTANKTSADMVLVASTPGDSLIKTVFGISQDKKVDFIRWDLAFHNGKSGQNTFNLDIVFGESKPNTLGFKDDKEEKSFTGKYTVSKSLAGKQQMDIYTLVLGDNPAANLSMLKINDNLFHLLTPENQLIVGNGGWSYSLNRKEPVIINSPVVSTLTTAPAVLKDTSLQVVFDGRTPCGDFARVADLNVSADCFKIKWRLILNRDPKTLLPATYVIKKSQNREADIVGNWKIITGTPSNPSAIIYQLYPENPDKSVSLLAGDENVLFFLNKSQQPFIGNNDFSFTLNKKKP